MKSDTEPLAEITNGAVYYWESADPGVQDRPTCYEGDAEIYPDWVRLTSGPGLGAWIPRERVQGVHES